MHELITALQFLVALIVDPAISALNTLAFYCFGTDGRNLSLLLVALAAGLLLVHAYGRLSDQQALRASKNLITASLLESVLYRTQLVTALRAQKNAVYAALRYLAQSAPALLLLAVPMFFVLAQLNLHFSFKPLPENAPALVKVDAAESALDTLRAETEGTGLQIETPLLRDRQSHSLLLRIRAAGSGAFGLKFFRGDDLEAAAAVIAAEAPTKVVPVLCKSAMCRLAYPGAGRLESDSVIERVEVFYPERSYRWAGIELHWLVWFFIFSLIAAVVGGRLSGIEL